MNDELSDLLDLPGPGRRRRLKRYLFLTLAGALVLLFAAYTFLRPTVPPNADLWNINRMPAMTFLDVDGEVIGSRGGLHTKPLSLEEIPYQLRLAFLVAEDKRFYEHGAVDWRGVMRALFVNVAEGELVQGGSTITQQLAKNIFLTQDRTFVRKVKEVILARDLESRLTKDQILELYLNRIYLGGAAFGVEAAAQTYFGKSARSVTLAEAAMLAGLAKAPSRYAPTTNLEAAQRRAEVILEQMRDEKVISEDQLNNAIEFPAALADRAITGDINYFIDYVSWEVENFVQSPDVDLVVRTTLDKTLQMKAEEAIKTVVDALPPERNLSQAALVSLSPEGAVRAMVGGRSYQKSQFNRAVQALRQPGSSFKPFVYLTALEQGMRPTTVYQDMPIKIGDWQPTNYVDVYDGPMTLTEAIEKSTNTVAVRLTLDVGAENVVATAHRLGIKSALEPNRSLPLGTSEVTLLELTDAYIPFATNGLASEPYGIVRIETKDGDVLFERSEPVQRRVIDPAVAEDMTYMLYKVMYEGTAKRAALPDRPSAGKTGTSQDWRDAWFMGFTANLVTGVWVGNDDNAPMSRVTGGEIPADIWKRYMTAAHEGLPVVALAGASPTRVVEGDSERRQFFAQLSSQFSRIADKPKGSSKKKRGFWIFGG